MKKLRCFSMTVTQPLAWLERMVLSKTLTALADEQDLQRSIEEIRELLNDVL